MKESSEKAAAPRRPSEKLLHTAVTSAGGAEAKDRATVSRTPLQMSPSGAKVEPWSQTAEATGFGAHFCRSFSIFVTSSKSGWLSTRASYVKLGDDFLPIFNRAFCFARRLSRHPTFCDQIIAPPDRAGCQVSLQTHQILASVTDWE